MQTPQASCARQDREHGGRGGRAHAEAAAEGRRRRRGEAKAGGARAGALARQGAREPHVGDGRAAAARAGRGRAERAGYAAREEVAANYCMSGTLYGMITPVVII